MATSSIRSWPARIRRRAGGTGVRRTSFADAASDMPRPGMWRRTGFRAGRIAGAEEELQQKLSCLPDRERLALRCMLVRDAFHMARLYATFLAASSVAEATGLSQPVPEEVDASTN